MFNAVTTMVIRDSSGMPHNPNSKVIILGGCKQAAYSTEKIRVKFVDNGQTAFLSMEELKLSGEC